MKAIALFLFPFLLGGFHAANRESYQDKACKKGEKLVLEDSTDEEVESYYAHVDTSLSGKAFVESLYDTISVDNTFVSYDDVTDWYKITDRDWENSREVDPDTYTFEGDKGNNYFLVQLYSSGNYDPSKAYNTDVNKFKTDKNVTGISWEDGKVESANLSIDKEHVWAKSHGFPVEKGDPAKGAGTDLHHLIAADSYTNSSGHNDLDFGEVKDKDTAKAIYSYNADGTRDLSGYRGKDENGHDVFEPMDEWKGDIARALFYMATRYSKEGDNTASEPYLVLTDDWSMDDDNALYHGVQHGLSTFLEWNKIDPVSDYEWKRNDLIDENVQNNRNPYVDHPEWVNQAFDPSFSMKPDLSNLQDDYHLYVGHPISLDVSLPQDVPGIEIDVSTSDKDVLEVNTDNRTLTPKKAGTAMVSYDITYLENEEKVSLKKSTQITVKDMPLLVDSNGNKIDEISLDLFKKQKLGLFLSDNYNEEIRLSSSDEDVLKIDEDGSVLAVRPGSAKITVSIDYYGESLILGEITVKVQVPLVLIIVAAIVLVLLLVLLLVFLRHRKKKAKRKKKRK